jgi:hypothetical protein
MKETPTTTPSLPAEVDQCLPDEMTSSAAYKSLTEDAKILLKLMYYHSNGGRDAIVFTDN